LVYKKPIANGKSEGADSLEEVEVYEPFLSLEGFMEGTSRGREVTQKAYEHLGKNRPGIALFS